MKEAQKVNVETTVDIPIEKAWKVWTEPEHIVKWNSASEDWHTPYAENDLRSGGKFIYRMEARDGTAGFHFSGIYNQVEKYKVIAYTLDDGRGVVMNFIDKGDKTEVVETFEAETESPVEYQRQGWQAIMDSYKTYAEHLS